MELTKKQESNSGASTYLIVPIVIFFLLLIFAVIRGPYLVSSTGFGGLIIVVAPLILATYALTVIVMAGRAGVDLSIGPLIGFINVGMIQLIGIGFIESPIAIFLYAIGVGIAYQILMALIIVFVRVQPIIVSLSGYLSLVGLNLIIMPRPSGLAPDWMYSWGAGTSIFSPVLVILIVATAGWYLLAQTAFWGNLKMMGSDERATYTSGVNVNMVRIGAHVVGGIYAGLAAITFTSLISSGDPSQGTTYTLMAVTALVLGGANLAGGRGSAFGALLGSLNIFLITFALSTFNFGKMQSFITDMSYGLMLVVSLLISIAIPFLQKRARGLSPGLVFLVMGIISAGVMVSVAMDKSFGVKRYKAFVAAVEQETLSAGTIMFFMIIGVVVGAYIIKMVFKHISAPMIGLLIILIITAFGLIFNPEATDTVFTPATIGLEYYSMSIFGLEQVSLSSESLSKSTSLFIGFIGVVLLSSLMILTMLPGIKKNIKRIAMILFISLIPVIAVGAVFFQDADKGYLMSSFSGEIYAILLVSALLFTITIPLVHTEIKNINNLFIGGISIVTLIIMYFFVGNSAVAIDPSLSSITNYSNPIIPTGLESVPAQLIEYSTPIRVNIESAGMAVVTEIAYIAIIIVLLQIFLRIAMEETSFKSFWKYWYIPIFATLAWSGLFFAIGVTIWKLIVIIAITVISAPNVMHIISTYIIGDHKDDAISKWEG
ncbi:ABC transporter permease [Candidatus Pseudothioglobus singularis]|nr:ABC transporter permease [Candidatus Pseudothioglobus singularis]MDB4822227.1 ABC transporter permease [Candidatus Pseudothioglobus singularis]